MSDFTTNSTRARGRLLSTGHSPRSTRAGFTLLELLIAIGIIAVLGTLIGVAVTRTRKGADKFKLAAQLQTIAVALEAYKADFGGYPTTSLDSTTTTADDLLNTTGLRGARVLCKALLGAGDQGALTGATATTGTFDTNRPNQDGHNGLGFRVMPRSGVFQIDQEKPTPPAPRENLAGKVYGPYLSSSQLKYRKTTAAGAIDDSVTDSDTYVFVDGNDQPILYYPVFATSASINLANTYVSDDTNFGSFMYRGTDNAAWLPLNVFRETLGDTSNDGAITGTEKPAVRGKYLLWTAGSDGIFGVNPSVAPNSPDRVDDVTNFQGE